MPSTIRHSWRGRRAAPAPLLLLSLLCAGLSSSAGAQVLSLRLAANVPANSPWDLGLKRMASEVARASDGRVRLLFTATAHGASETDIIQKMRLGVDAALLTSHGLAELYPDCLALSMPSFIRDDREFDAVLGAMTPLIRARLADRYFVPALSKGGWVRYFSSSRIVLPSDLVGLRISVNPIDQKMITLMQSAGARVVPGTIADFLLQVNSDTVDAICTSPIFVATLWSQLRGKIAYMSSFPVAPFIGAIVFNKSSWERIPPELRPRIEEALKGIARTIGEDSVRLEKEAIASLDGIRIPPGSPEAAARWAETIAQKRDTLIARMFSAEVLDAIEGALAQARHGK